MRITARNMGRNSYLTYKISNRLSGSSNMVNSLLNNLSKSTNRTTNDLNSLAAQYGSLKSNNRVLKSYYRQIGRNNNTNSTNNTVNSNVNASNNKDAAKSLVDASKSLKDDAIALAEKGRKSIFKTDAEGKYDMDAISSAVSDFVGSYNSTRSAVINSGNSRAIQTAVSMVSSTASMEKSLNKVGITINNDNSLAFDSDKFKESDMSTIESLFNGTGSYAYGVANKASQLESYATIDAARNANMFSGYSGYSGTRGSIIDMWV